MIRINDTISIQPDEIEEHFIRAGGPGGQNVNKVSTAVQLRFDVHRCKSLTERVRRRLESLAGSKLTKNGVIIITANRHRTQEANRRDALDRLIAMIIEADQRPKYRVTTRPGRAAKMRRTDSKVKRGNVKKLRSKRISRED
ncbi:MAG: alternative ribosome rescue aminoacyl-tRNA hydrolase ArfB [Myxococcota bacterium]|jgi:ribosome-associated protein|nr:alternative ribosome rescue aminoacyl-tRNA hydrolase ArfB [Alphaproteobacteria bacterium]MDE0883591.1 alternative ribosome rescue aminoacyl-tRNA hydrolase ArfB [Myxococcota bacterium]